MAYKQKYTKSAFPFKTEEKTYTKEKKKLKRENLKKEKKDLPTLPPYKRPTGPRAN